MSENGNKVEDTEIRVVAYDPYWSVLFKEEAYSIRNAISDIVISIEHFGRFKFIKAR